MMRQFKRALTERNTFGLLMKTHCQQTTQINLHPHGVSLVVIFQQSQGCFESEAGCR